MPRERGQKPIASNKRARHDFFIEEVFEVGIVLTGTEVKSLRGGKASIGDSYGVIERSELWLENAYIPELTQGSWTNHVPRRRRKLLLKKGDISDLAKKTSQTGYTLVPISLYFKDGFAKLELGLGRGKKSFDKREKLRQRDADREIHRNSGTKQDREPPFR